jgi:OmcA/MtrC family decaheme c-type cytochrome
MFHHLHCYRIYGLKISRTTARRPIVTNQKCNDCHAALGIFTAKVYHAAQRNDAPTCTYCHNTDRVAANGWGDNIKDAVHALHGASKRVNKYSWEVSAGNKYWTITYPSVLNNCEACHVPGSYDFDIINGADPATTNQVFGNLLWSTVATGTLPNPVNVIVTGNETVPGTYWSPMAAASGAGFVFGSGFSYNSGTGATTLGAATNLVTGTR